MELAFALDAKLDRLIPESLRSDPEVLRQAKRVAALDFAFSFWAVLFAALYVVLDSPLCGLTTLTALVPISASLLVLRAGGSPVVAGNLLCLAGFITLSLLGMLTGGWIGVPPMVWYAVLPAVAVLTCGTWWGVAWTLIGSGSIGLFAVAQAYHVSFPNHLDPWATHFFGFAVIVGLLACQFMMASVRDGIEQRAHVALRRTRQELARVKRDANELKACFGISLDDWKRLQREKAALEYFVSRRLGIAEPQDVLDQIGFGEPKPADEVADESSPHESASAAALPQ